MECRTAERRWPDLSSKKTLTKPDSKPEPADADPHPVLRLLDEWLADDSGYDERVWPELKRALEENPVQFREVRVDWTEDDQ